MQFSILIPTWNNFPYLQLCIRSIQKNSNKSHQILVHINETNAEIEDYLHAQQIQFTTSAANIGICKALNTLSTLIEHDYVVYMNDDMYCLPNWDLHLSNEIAKIPHEKFMLSGTMIEPIASGNKAVIVANFGTDIQSFREEDLLKQYMHFQHQDWSGSSWPPNVVHKKMWNLLSGYNEAFSPGMSSDDDFAMRMWQAGCRIFKGVSASRVYHFQCKSTGRIKKNNGRVQFANTYHMSQHMFNKFYLRKGEIYQGPLIEPNSFNLSLILKKIGFRLKQIMRYFFTS